MKKVIATTVSVALVLAGCATASKDLAATYVSPIQYQTYDCEQLTAEQQRIQGRVSQLAGQLDTAAANDKAIAGVSLLLFWPAAFALGGTKGQEAEYSRLRGESDALQQAAISKKCSSVVARPASSVKVIAITNDDKPASAIP